MASQYKYVIVYPDRFATRFTIYAAPADRAEELRRFAEQQCPATGYVSDLDSDDAARRLWAQPWKAFGWTTDDEYTPDDEAISLHYEQCTGRRSAPSCTVCHPPKGAWVDRLVTRVVAELDRVQVS